MDEAVINKLIDLNKGFYQSFGAAFTETRRRLQPGVQRMIENRIKDGNWLDIGCGSGVLGKTLAQSSFKGSYQGLDFSPALLAEAQKSAAELDLREDFSLAYRPANLLDPDWARAADSAPYDGVIAFAVLHHLPGSQHRARILQQIAGLMRPGGLFIHSEWQFQRNPKLAARAQPWSRVGLSEDEVETGDTLLDWRHFTAGQESEPGLRYVHLFSKKELDDLIGSSGFKLIEEFDSDGATGNLGLYQVWQKQN